MLVAQRTERAIAADILMLMRWVKRFGVYGGLMLLTVSAGLILRFVPLRLPAFVVKYGGSTMWALMIYWVFTVIRPQWSVVRTVIVAGFVATAVEFLKLYRVGWLDAFRVTLPGILLLGRYFAWGDIWAYWVAIAVGAMVDSVCVRRVGAWPDTLVARKS